MWHSTYCNVCRGRTIFIPEGSESNDALKYRPITIASHILQAFHKVMACRCDAFLPLKYTQKGFWKGDVIAQHVFTLQAIIDEAKRECRSLNLVFLDVRKAFDSVSHDTIVLAMRRLGCPGPFLSYIQDLYLRLSAVIEHNGERSAPIFTGREVKQGDLLSPFMFNARAPLKPHQRMVILKNFLMPKYLHELVLAPVGNG